MGWNRSPERHRPMDISARIKFAPHWTALPICVFAALLASCGRLSLGSYGTAAAGTAASDTLGASGWPGASGHGNASGGAPQSHSTAGAQQAGSPPAFGGDSNGAFQGGSGGMDASSGGMDASSGGMDASSGGMDASSGGIGGMGA